MKAGTSAGLALRSRLVVDDMPVPVPGPGDVLVEVHAASVNPKDWKINTTVNALVPTISSRVRPLALGDDLAGIVVDKGARVDGFEVGDEVYGMDMNLRTGSIAEYAVIDQGRIAKKPSNLDFAQAAAVPLAGLTALQGLRIAHVDSDSRVLIIGASGGVGTFAVQIAKALGAHVTGVCSGRNAPLVESLGADAIIDYTQRDYTRETDDFNAVLDAVSRQSLASCASLMSPGGIFVTTVGGAKSAVGLARAAFSSGRRRARAVMVNSNTADLDTLRHYIEDGIVKPVIDSEYPMHEFAKAYEKSKTGRTVGKLVIRIRDSA